MARECPVNRVLSGAPAADLVASARLSTRFADTTLQSADPVLKLINACVDSCVAEWFNAGTGARLSMEL